VSSPSDNPLLHARGLEFSYARDQALRGVSIDIGAAESVAITGPSGSGKSTLLHCLCGLLVPQAGEIWVNGTALHTLNEAGRAALRRAMFGVVYQFNQLLPELTVAENTALPLLFGGARPSEARARARGWLERLEIDDCAERRPGELSGGQAQRAAIARAMAGDPRVLLADEPTGALDTAEAENVLRILRSAVISHGVTLVMVTHDPTVVGYTDRAVRLVDGMVAGTSAPTLEVRSR
jgi:putative ABC transport system ATP-binding protein